MSTRSLLILAGVALILVLYLFFFGVEDPGSRKLAEQKSRLFQFDPAQIERFEVTNSQGTILLVRDSSREWRIEKPIEYPANTQLIDRALSELEFAKKAASLDSGSIDNLDEMMRQFGLIEPRIDIKFRDAEHAFRLSIGNETARQGNYYAQIRSGSASELVVIGKEIEMLIDSKAGVDAWRSKAIFNFKTTSVTSIELQNKATSVELRKELNDWLITKPFSGKTEPNSVISYLGGILNSRVHDFVGGNQTKLADFGLNTPQVTLTIHTGEVSQILSLGSKVPDQEDLYYASISTKDAVFRVRSEFFDQVVSLLDRTREKRFLYQPLAAVTRIEIVSSGNVLSVHRDGANWLFPADDVLADSDAVAEYYTKLTEAKGTEFYEKTDARRKEFQLDIPETEIKVFSTADESADPETLNQSVIRISAEMEGFHYVESDASDFIMKVDASTLPEIPSTRTPWLARKLTLPDPQEWKSITWNAQGSDLHIVRDAEGNWPEIWQERKLDLDFLNRQIKLLGSLEILKRVKIEEPITESDLIWIVKTDQNRQWIFKFTRPQNREVVMQVNGDPEAYLIAEADYQILTVFPLDRTKPDSQ